MEEVCVIRVQGRIRLGKEVCTEGVESQGSMRREE
jgi:hypothetical protein